MGAVNGEVASLHLNVLVGNFNRGARCGLLGLILLKQLRVKSDMLILSLLHGLARRPLLVCVERRQNLADCYSIYLPPSRCCDSQSICLLFSEV